MCFDPFRCAGLALDGGHGASLQVLLAAPWAAYEPGALDTLQRVVPVAELPCASATAQGGAALCVCYPHTIMWRFESGPH